MLLRGGEVTGRCDWLEGEIEMVWVGLGVGDCMIGRG